MIKLAKILIVFLLCAIIIPIVLAILYAIYSIWLVY